MITTDLQEVWTLERASPHRDSYEGRRLQSVKSIEAYAGVDGSGEARFVAIRLASAERRNVADRYPRSSKGIAVEAVESKGGRLAFFLREQPGVPEGVFPAVIADVLAAGEAAPRDKGLRVALERFASWQAALSKRQGEMSAQETRGIIGELVVARDLLMPWLGAGRVVLVWRAPEDDHPHDFVGKGWELEVKAFLAPGDSFHVNADGQLEPEPSNRLFVAGVGLEPDEGGISLNELAQQMIESGRLEPEIKQDLRNALIRRGGMARSLDAEASRRYRVAGIELFAIREGFPRILKGAIPRGVSAVRYEVSLSACGDFRTDAAALANEVKTMEQAK